MTAAKHKLSVLAARVAWCTRTPEEAGRMVRNKVSHLFLSHDDAARFFQASVEAQEPAPGRFAVLYAASRPPPGWPLAFDPEPARQLIGFEAQDYYPQGLPFDAPPLNEAS